MTTLEDVLTRIEALEDYEKRLDDTVGAVASVLDTRSTAIGSRLDALDKLVENVADQQTEDRDNFIGRLEALEEDASRARPGITWVESTNKRIAELEARQLHPITRDWIAAVNNRIDLVERVAVEDAEQVRRADWKRTYNAALPALIIRYPEEPHAFAAAHAADFADRAHGKLEATEEKSYPAASVERLAIAAANAQPHVSSRGVKRALFEALREFREIVEVPDEESP